MIFSIFSSNTFLFYSFLLKYLLLLEYENWDVGGYGAIAIRFVRDSTDMVDIH